MKKWRLKREETPAAQAMRLDLPACPTCGADRGMPCRGGQDTDIDGYYNPLLGDQRVDRRPHTDRAVLQ